MRSDSQAQVTLNEDAKQRAVTKVNSNQPRNTYLCEPTVSSAREGWKKLGMKWTNEPTSSTGVLEMARCESLTTLGREVLYDTNGPLVTAWYKETKSEQVV